ncbi:hypothetical protein C8Q74DRAFT_1304171 [Fomes fomentarius]|nr:hypothetical protein C8Q74DRAFT_1304171 [Fomes fomentarius]
MDRRRLPRVPDSRDPHAGRRMWESSGRPSTLPSASRSSPEPDEADPATGDFEIAESDAVVCPDFKHHLSVHDLLDILGSRPTGDPARLCMQPIASHPATPMCAIGHCQVLMSLPCRGSTRRR